MVVNSRVFTVSMPKELCEYVEALAQETDSSVSAAMQEIVAEHKYRHDPEMWPNFDFCRGYSHAMAEIASDCTDKSLRVAASVKVRPSQ